MTWSGPTAWRAASWPGRGPGSTSCSGRREVGAGCRCAEDTQRAFAPFWDAVADLIGLWGRHRDHAVLGSVGANKLAYWRLREAVCGLPPRPDGGAQDAEEASACPQRLRGVAAGGE